MNILLIIFNRPDKVTKLIDALRVVRPARIYVAADGPRSDVPTDGKLCAEARAAVSNIDWPCEVHTDFLDHNIGVDRRVPSAIDWMFMTEEEGIILEDDCLPGGDFFKFCAELLQRYRNVPRVMMISGNNFQDGIVRGGSSDVASPSYYFSRYANTWGWATWKRAWAAYQDDLRGLEGFIKSRKIHTAVTRPREQRYWLKFFKKIHQGIYPFWDAKWVFSIWNADGICVTPNVNLVANIGHGKDATHTTDENSRHIKKIEAMDLPLVHPCSITVSEAADRYLFSVLYHVPLYKRIWNKISATITR